MACISLLACITDGLVYIPTRQIPDKSHNESIFDRPLDFQAIENTSVTARFSIEGEGRFGARRFVGPANPVESRKLRRISNYGARERSPTDCRLRSSPSRKSAPSETQIRSGIQNTFVIMLFLIRHWCRSRPRTEDRLTMFDLAAA